MMLLCMSPPPPISNFEPDYRLIEGWHGLRSIGCYCNAVNVNVNSVTDEQSCEAGVTLCHLLYNPDVRL